MSLIVPARNRCGPLFAEKPVKRAKRMSQRRPSKESKGRPGMFVPSPLNGVNPEALKAALIAIGREKAEDFPRHLTRLLTLFRAKQPIQILATLSFYGSSVQITSDGVGETLNSVLQHHIELLQALVLTLGWDEWGAMPAVPGDIQTVIDEVKGLAESFHQRRYARAGEERDKQSEVVMMLGETMRVHTQVVRNWGYFSQVTSISRELYSPLDAAYASRLGFSASSVIVVAERLTKAFEERVDRRYTLLRRVYRERKTHKMVRAYFKSFPNLSENTDDFARLFPKGTPAENVMGAIMAHADLSLPDLIEYNPADISNSTDLGLDVVNAVLGAVSLRPGDLKGRSEEELLLDNPVWLAAGIAIDDRWIFPAPHMIFSHIHEVMRSLGIRAGLGEGVSRRRAVYLEEKVSGLIAHVLPGSKILLNQKWGDSYETDLIAVLDRTILIVESKSATLTGPGLRGAPDRMKRHIRELIVDPSAQSSRLASLIRSAGGGDAEAKSSLPDLGLPLEGVRTVIRLSVTLDDFSVVAMSEGELRQAGWLPADLELAPTMNIADLVSTVEILDRPALFLHYLAERSRFQKAVNILGDELDLLGMYLDTGFNTLGTEESVDTFAISGKSQVLDHFFNSRDAGVAVNKPKPRFTPYFDSLIRKLQAEQPGGWIDISLDLLRLMDFHEQRDLLRGLERLRTNVLRNWRDPGHECSLAVKPHPKRDTGAVFYVYPPQLAGKRSEAVHELAARALKEYELERCIVISRCTDSWGDVYSAIGVAQVRGRTRSVD
jgi:hypothetical protein